MRSRASLPVVASDIAGYRDVVTSETAVTVAPGDPGALADGVTALLADEPRRESMGVAAGQLAVESYSWGDIASVSSGSTSRRSRPAPKRAAA